MEYPDCHHIQTMVFASIWKPFLNLLLFVIVSVVFVVAVVVVAAVAVAAAVVFENNFYNFFISLSTKKKFVLNTSLKSLFEI